MTQPATRVETHPSCRPFPEFGFVLSALWRTTTASGEWSLQGEQKVLFYMSLSFSLSLLSSPLGAYLLCPRKLTCPSCPEGESVCVSVFLGWLCVRECMHVYVSGPVVCVGAGEGRGVRNTWSFSQTPDSEHVKLFSSAAPRPALANLPVLSGHQLGFPNRAPSRGEPWCVSPQIPWCWGNLCWSW